MDALFLLTILGLAAAIAGMTLGIGRLEGGK
jgi:hypothetical protein